MKPTIIFAKPKSLDHVPELLDCYRHHRGDLYMIVRCINALSLTNEYALMNLKTGCYYGSEYVEDINDVFENNAHFFTYCPNVTITVE